MYCSLAVIALIYLKMAVPVQEVSKAFHDKVEEEAASNGTASIVGSVSTRDVVSSCYFREALSLSS